MALMYVLPVSCASGVPRRSRSGPMQAQTDPQTRPFFSSSACTYFGSMWDGSSIGISTDSKPHFLNMGNSLVESLVKGDVNKNVLIPSLMGGYCPWQGENFNGLSEGRWDMGKARSFISARCVCIVVAMAFIHFLPPSTTRAAALFYGGSVV